MGRYTDFSGEILLVDEKVIKYLKSQIEMDWDDADYPIKNFFDAKIVKDKLIVNSYERNYEEDVEQALAMLILLDPKATGEVLSTYSDGTIESDPKIREKFILKQGKVFKRILKEVKCIYHTEKEYKPGFDEETIEDCKRNVNRFSEMELCGFCKNAINLGEFDFSKRKYYEIIKENTGFKHCCKKCYTKNKKPYVEEEKLRREFTSKLEEIESKKFTESKKVVK